MPPYVWLIIFHPILVTLLALIALVLLLRWTGLWARYRYWIVAALLAAYAIDAGFALPRVLFAHGLSKAPVVAQRIPLPRRLVLVDIPCIAKCHDLLISGAVEEIISVIPARPQHASVANAVRYNAGWTIPGTCKSKTRSLDPRELPSEAQRKSGYCPLVEPVEVPKEGIFLIRESTLVTAKQPARPYTPTYLVKAPPGPVIRFAGIEVQNRNAAGTTVLASAYRYEAPGLLGLPPLIGCWDRPDNVIWVMPPGDTGCGFWRWFTWGGDEKGSADPKWIYDEIFGPPDRAVVPPKKPELSPPLPAEALEILAKAEPFDDYLPGLRAQVLDPSNNDQALTELVARLARRGNLEGSLIALLAVNRPAALVGLGGLLNPVPYTFVKSGAVLAEMEKSRKFRDEFADTMFLVLASNWQTKDDVGRFLTLMETAHPGWLCNRLGRIADLVTARESRMKNIEEPMPPFIPPVIQRTAQVCPAQSAEVMRGLLSTSRPRRRGEMANLIVVGAPNLAPELALQAVVNLSEDPKSLASPYKSEAQRYSEAHLAILRAARQPCETLARNLEGLIRQETEQHRVPSGMLIQNLERIRNGQAEEFCTN